MVEFWIKWFHVLHSRWLCPWRFTFFRNIFGANDAFEIKINDKFKHKWSIPKSVLYFKCVCKSMTRQRQSGLRSGSNTSKWMKTKSVDRWTEFLNNWKKKNKAEKLKWFSLHPVNKYYELHPLLIRMWIEIMCTYWCCRNWIKDDLWCAYICVCVWYVGHLNRIYTSAVPMFIEADQLPAILQIVSMTKAYGNCF